MQLILLAHDQPLAAQTFQPELLDCCRLSGLRVRCLDRAEIFAALAQDRRPPRAQLLVLPRRYLLFGCSHLPSIGCSPLTPSYPQMGVVPLRGLACTRS